MRHDLAIQLGTGSRLKRCMLLLQQLTENMCTTITMLMSSLLQNPQLACTCGHQMPLFLLSWSLTLAARCSAWHGTRRLGSQTCCYVYACTCGTHARPSTRPRGTRATLSASLTKALLFQAADDCSLKLCNAWLRASRLFNGCRLALMLQSLNTCRCSKRWCTCTIAAAALPCFALHCTHSKSLLAFRAAAAGSISAVSMFRLSAMGGQPC